MTQTVKVMPWGKGQGDYVVINAEDFDPSKHKLLDDFLNEQAEAQALAKAESLAKEQAEAEQKAQAEAQAQQQQNTDDSGKDQGSATGKAPTKPEIIKMLQDAEIEHNPSATKAELMALLPKV